jgi:heme-degrading monooxygenase HmoA
MDVIARIWRGWTQPADADVYLDYVLKTGGKEYRETPGNRAAYVLRRRVGDRVEFLTLSFWDSLEAVKGFAGPDVDRAVFYPEDDKFLIDRELKVSHYELIDTTEKVP